MLDRLPESFHRTNSGYITITSTPSLPSSYLNFASVRVDDI